MSLKRARNALEQDSQPSAPFVVYGTALPPLDPDVRDDGSYVPLWKQEVTDERGRKRLHGAFTGGFSAGYFNTVGSKEGWTPTAFKSSRGSRAKATQARPEDFMDAEDLAEAAEAQRLETNENFSGLGSTEEEMHRRGKPATLIDLLTPAVQDTMGIKLLKKMGWKEGQGIGPKVRRKAIDSDESHEDAGGEEKLYLFAPKNSSLVTFQKKKDSAGLGYVREDSLREQGSKDQSLPELEPSSTVTKKKAVKGGFGVGILNDDGEDDDDIYEIRPKTSYNRVIGGGNKKVPKQSSITKNPAKHVFISKKASKAKGSLNLRKCHDGRLPLDGFILSDEPMQSQDGWHPPPEVPADWVSVMQGPPPSNTQPQQSLTDAARSSKLDPRTRGALLGEAPLPGKSVFDFLTPAARDRIASASGKTNLPPALGEAPPLGHTASGSSLADLVPKMDGDMAMEALRGGFMPYADDLDKRARYRSFLEYQAKLKQGLPDRKYGMTTQDWIKELNEFMGAARIFKPLTGMIATRFTSSTGLSNIQSSSREDSVNNDPNVFIHRPAPKSEDPVEAAAKMSMYGPMTRSVIEFFPTRLLCKRFNVRPPTHVDPTGGNGDEGHRPQAQAPAGPSKELVSKAQMTEMMREARGNEGYRESAGESKFVEEIPQVDAERNDALEGDRPGEDVFKAIFGGEDEDEED